MMADLNKNIPCPGDSRSQYDNVGSCMLSIRDQGDISEYSS